MTIGMLQIMAYYIVVSFPWTHTLLTTASRCFCSIFATTTSKWHQLCWTHAALFSTTVQTTTRRQRFYWSNWCANGRWSLWISASSFWLTMPSTNAILWLWVPLHWRGRDHQCMTMSGGCSSRICQLVTVKKVLRAMRKLDWTDAQVAAYAVKCPSSPWVPWYNCIQWMASVLARVMWFHDWFGYCIVYNILEDIHRGLSKRWRRNVEMMECTISLCCMEMHNFWCFLMDSAYGFCSAVLCIFNIRYGITWIKMLPMDV